MAEDNSLHGRQQGLPDIIGIFAEKLCCWPRHSTSVYHTIELSNVDYKNNRNCYSELLHIFIYVLHIQTIERREMS